jgi:hypothetical protein
VQKNYAIAYFLKRKPIRIGYILHNLAYLLHFLFAVAGVVLIYCYKPEKAFPALNIYDNGRLNWRVGLVGLCAIAFALISYRASYPPVSFWDFLYAYYPAGHALAHNDPVAFRNIIGIGAEGGFVNIPVVAWLFAPLGWLPPQLAGLVLTLVGLGVTVLAWFWLVRLAKLENRGRWLLAFLFLLNGPLLNGIKFANLSYFIIAALAGGLLLIRSGRSGAAGVLLGLATVIKPPLVLFGFFFLLRRDLRGTLAYGAVGIATILLSLLLFGWNLNLLWFQTCIVQYSQNWLPTFSVQSIPGFILRLHEDARLTDWVPQLPTVGQKVVAKILTGLIFVVALMACYRRSSKDGSLAGFELSKRLDLQYLLVICLCLVTSPLAWSHYYAWLLMPAAFLLGQDSPLHKSRVIQWLGLAAFAMVTPLIGTPWQISNSPLLTFYRSFAMSHLFFGGLLASGLVAWWLARTDGLLKPVDEPGR